MLIGVAMNGNLREVLRLLLVTDDRLLAGRDPVAVCRAAVSGGVTAVQLRLKQAGDRELLSLARVLVRELTVPVFVNDRLDVALAAGAHGVHLGEDDLPVAAARRIVPAGFILGASVGSPDEAVAGVEADYWGIGPLRVTSTKVDAGEALSREGGRRLLQLAGSRPCVVIGGVLPEDVTPALDDGFAGVAVVSGILGEADVGAAAGKYSANGERRIANGE